jgi:hypothetical protein
MKKFKITYNFDGTGEVEVEAKTSHDAREKWYDGEFDPDTEKEWGETYTIEDVEEIKTEEYDYEKENNKVCPVCKKTIDYHVDGFNRIKPENLWYCREHTAKEIQKTLKRHLTLSEIKWIDEWE